MGYLSIYSVLSNNSVMFVMIEIWLQLTTLPGSNFSFAHSLNLVLPLSVAVRWTVLSSRFFCFSWFMNSCGKKSYGSGWHYWQSIAHHSISKSCTLDNSGIGWAPCCPLTSCFCACWLWWAWCFAVAGSCFGRRSGFGSRRRPCSDITSYVVAVGCLKVVGCCGGR